MRPTLALALAALVTPALMAWPDDKVSRYGVQLDVKSYPQSTPTEALASVLKAAEANKVDYLVAHLAEPGFVDERIKRVYGGKFEEQVADTRARLDPGTIRQLKRYQKEGEWEVKQSRATLSLKDVKDRVIRLSQQGGRWYLEHASSPR